MFRAPRKSWFYQQTGPDQPAWRIRYHGTAGFTIASQQTTIVLDPFVSRPGLLETGLRPLHPDRQAIQSHFPHADAVLVGHAHHDHILDAPDLCLQTGAQFVGSADAANVARAAGVSDTQITITEGREDIHFGSATVRGIPSKHGRVYFGRVTLPGSIPKPPPWPPRVWDLKHGHVLNWHVDLGGMRVVHIDSADLIDRELNGLEADVVCLCAIGRKFRPNYVRSVVESLKPKWIIPCHWDWFFTPYNAAPRLLPGVDLPGFIDEISAAGVEPVLLPFGGDFALSQSALPK